MYKSYALTEKEVAEIYYLGTEGCPCCKQPLPSNLLARRYRCSTSTVSRILHGHTPSQNLEGTRKEKVELNRRVASGA